MASISILLMWHTACLYNCRMVSRCWFALLLASIAAFAQPQPSSTIVLRPARVFDGDTMHQGWAVRVKGDRIDAAGPAAAMDAAGGNLVDLAGATLMPGL